MRDDRALIFREIHGSKEALLTAAKEIERIALVKTYEIGPLHLRFLEPYPQGGSSHDYLLTPARDYRVIDFASQEYLTVSYVWSHLQPIDGVHIPEYRIWDGADLEQSSRLLRCPPIVFHRVVQFMKAQNLARVWIDQECIDQEDPNNVERHLQNMHRVYRFSRLTVAVLASASHDWMDLQDFLCPAHELLQNADRMHTIERLLRKIIADAWFTRSWTFHEQHCAAHLVYLLPRPPLADYTVTPDGFTETPDKKLPKDIRVDHVSLMQFFRLCKEMNKNDPGLESNFVRHGDAGLIFTEVPGDIATVQKKMEKRENRVLSDRIQIIANVCGLGWKLKTTLLNNPRQSYSTCLLALAMANTWPDPIERARQYQIRVETFMSGDVGAVLRDLSNSQRVDLWRLPGFYATD